MAETLWAASATVCFLSLGVAFVSFVYSFVEMIAVRHFAPFAFSTGKVVVRLEEPLIFRPAAVPARGMTAHAAFRVIHPTRCLFWAPNSTLFWFDCTPLLLKGTIDVADGRAVTVGRLALGPSAYYAAFLMTFTAGLPQLLLVGWSLSSVVLLILFCWGVIGVFAIPSFLFAQRGFRRAYDEVMDTLRPTIRL